jgi:hypothetical protein
MFRIIAKGLTMKQDTVTPAFAAEEPETITPGRGTAESALWFRAKLKELGWTQGELARQLGCRPELVQRWGRDAPGYVVPDGVAAWLRRRAAAAVADPPPQDWRRPKLGRAAA